MKLRRHVDFHRLLFKIYLAVVALAAIAVAADTPHNLARSAEDKLDYIQRNGERQHPDARPTQLSEDEINAYLASGKVKIPDGVENLRLIGVPGKITGSCRVNFDRVRAGRGGSNPLLELFSGMHDVSVEARASGVNSQGHVHIDSVVIDGVEVPEFVLELFVKKYVTPKYPGVGIDSTFALPSKIDTATVGAHTLTVTQH